jgi:methylated-DNA-protein-cysteine methyltransferase related protein
MNVDDVERVRAAVAAIPPGSVLAYGQVAARAGLPGRARLVGRILAEDGDDLPWHRVLRADGTPPPHLAVEQLARLRDEGVPTEGGRVSMTPRRKPHDVGR